MVLGIDAEHLLGQVICFGIVQSVVIVRIVLDQLPATITNDLLIARVVPIDGPERRRFLIGKRHGMCNDVVFLRLHIGSEAVGCQNR